MVLDYTELNNCIEAMNTVVGNDKTGMSNIVILSNPTDSTMTFVGISANYQVIRVAHPEYEENEINAEILVNYKKLSELVALSKPTSGIDTEIIITIDASRKELQYKLTKLTAAKSRYEEAKANRKVLSRLYQTIDFTYVYEDKRQGGLEAVSIDWLLKLENDSAENTDTCAWELNNFINTMSKMTAGDAGQVIMSNQTKVVATCNSNYAVYKEDQSAGMSVVFQTSILTKILSILRTLKTTDREEKLVVLHKYDSRLAIFDEDHTFVIQTDMPLARKLMLNHINGFNSADYSHAGAVIRKDILLDTIKCFEKLTGSAQASMTFYEKDGETFMKLVVPNSTSRQNDMTVIIWDMLGDTDIFNKPFGVSIATLLQILNVCDTTSVCLSIAIPDAAETQTTVPTNGEESTVQALLKIASIQENNTEGLKCYSVLG